MTTGQTAGLLKAEIDGYQVQWKDDGTDYPGLLADFKAGRLKTVQIRNHCKHHSHRQVYRAEVGGRGFIIKHDRWAEHRFKNLLRNRVYGSYYARMIRLVNAAVNRGCRVVQDIYLVAEKKDGPHSRENYFIAQYVDGRPVAELSGDGQAWAMGETLAELHDCGLASQDIHPGNFISTAQGLVVIDICIDRALLRCQANDVLKMWIRYGVKMPVRGRALKIASALLSLRWSLRLFLRRLRCGLGRGQS